MSLRVESSVSAVHSRFAAPWRLQYYRDKFGNFGDDLNRWLWPRLLNDRTSTMLLGIGTILNGKLPPGPKVKLGSGVGYGTVPQLDDDWAVHFVRGPRSARALGLPESYSITDPAHLITQIIPPVAHGLGTVYIPHHASAFVTDWRAVRYVNRASEFMRVVEAIHAARLVVTSAMHGAILADAFRVPWIRVAEYPHLNDFKWQDWRDSVGVTTTRDSLPALSDRSANRFGKTAVRTLRAWKRAGRIFRPNKVASPALVSDRAEFDATVAQLRLLNDASLGSLSLDTVLDERVRQLVDAIAQLTRQRHPRRS